MAKVDSALPGGHAGSDAKPEQPAAADSAPSKSTPDSITLKAVVAIHGIGEQLHAETIRSVANRLCADFGPALPILPILPLGRFDLGDGEPLQLPQLIEPVPDGWKSTDFRQRVYLGEVYWADIAHTVAMTNNTLERATSWGKTIVSRAEALYDGSTQEVRDEERLAPEDFSLAGGVVDEIVETIQVLENLSFLAAKAGLFKFDLAPLLRDYVGDVQLVADFPDKRRRIVQHFQDTLKAVHDALDNTARKLVAPAGPAAEVKKEIYIVAHSEGTVVSFLGMLEALVQQRAAKGSPDTANALQWVDHLCGYMTIGSPLDKHLVLWPEIWTQLEDTCEELRKDGGLVRRRGLPLIPWKNYTDEGDPIGFQLDTTRDWMKRHDVKVFDFTKDDDYLFQRYLFPGKAHVDYWEDPAVFRHFITNVVDTSGKRAPAPGPKKFEAFVSPKIPFALSFAIHVAGAYALYKAVATFIDSKHASGFMTALNVLALAFLLFGVTVGARIPRLVKRKRRNFGQAFGWFLLSSLPLFSLAAVLDAQSAPMLARIATLAGKYAHAPQSLLTAAAIVVALGAIPTIFGAQAKRVPRSGRKRLLRIGAGAVLLLVLAAATAPSVTPVSPGQVPESRSVWPLMLAGALFLYGWWLGILTFDLSFIWTRYVRAQVDLVKRVARWRWPDDKTDAAAAVKRAAGTKVGY